MCSSDLSSWSPPQRSESVSTVLRTADLHVSLGGTPALKGVGLRVEEGEKVALLGPNGSGKTTLLRVLAGIAPPTSGRATLRGRDLREIPDGRRAQMLAFLAQEEHTDLPFTARDVLLLARSVGLSDWRDWLEHEKEIAKQQLLNEGKSEKLLEKIIPGKVKAILKEVCLVELKQGIFQVFQSTY